jgi:hypothetical protein
MSMSVTNFPSLAVTAACLVLAGSGMGASPASTEAGPRTNGNASAARFDATELKSAVEPGVNVVELVYEFTNTGEIPLIVQEFAHGCTCMQGTWDGVPVKPGARGKITAKLLTKGLRGTVRKSLHVKFVEGGTVELTGEVNIPEALAYSERTLRWAIGEEAQPKQVDIVVNSEAPVRILSVSANDPVFSCKLETIKEGRSYRIVITPGNTATARLCVMQVRTDAKDPRDALQGLFALVEKPKTEGAAR